MAFSARLLLSARSDNDNWSERFLSRWERRGCAIEQRSTWVPELQAAEQSRLPKKVKELIAVGISVVINCESCMQWHIEQAAAAGATEREVLEAIEVGIEMGGGPATAHARFALGVMTSVFGTHGDT